MRFRLYREYGALNSVPVFNALEKSIIKRGHTIVNDDPDVVVIWSVLWAGRMLGNKEIYNHCIANNIPVIILEVGNLIRGVTWRVGLTNVNNHGYFGQFENLDENRPKKLGLELFKSYNERRPEILIATQRSHSLQWKDQPDLLSYVDELTKEIRKYSDRIIIVRPHPRDVFKTYHIMDLPNKIVGTYDTFDINYNFHCVINFNSGPGIQAAIAGTPVICHSSSLAYPVSSDIKDIENIKLPDRRAWFIKICHTEYTLDEIEEGIPLKRLHF
jgi:hypothetical protein